MKRGRKRGRKRERGREEGRGEGKNSGEFQKIQSKFSSWKNIEHKANTSICSCLEDNSQSVINKYRFVGINYQVSNQLYKYKLGITGQTSHKLEEPKDQYQSTTGCGSTNYGYCKKSKPHLRLLGQGVLPRTRCLCDCCLFLGVLRSLLHISGWCVHQLSRMVLANSQPAGD